MSLLLEAGMGAAPLSSEKRFQRAQEKAGKRLEADAKTVYPRPPTNYDINLLEAGNPGLKISKFSVTGLTVATPVDIICLNGELVYKKGKLKRDSIRLKRGERVKAVRYFEGDEVRVGICYDPNGGDVVSIERVITAVRALTPNGSVSTE